MSDYRDLKKYYPTLVSNESGKKIRGEGRARVVRLHALPPKTQQILLSDRIVDLIYGVEQRFHLNDMQTEEFSRTVRQFFFREITEGGFAKKVAELCNISHDEALKLLTTIKTLDVREQNTVEEKQRNIINLSLAQARERYPQIMRQLITQNMITSQKFSEPLKPTVQNWIAVYEKTLDVSNHNAIERGNFVYRADATRNLSGSERQKLATVFKSRDEGTPLMIDQDRGVIIFQSPPTENDNRENNTREVDEQKKGFFGTGVYMNEKTPPVSKSYTMQGAAKEIEQFSQNTQNRAQMQSQDHDMQSDHNMPSPHTQKEDGADIKNISAQLTQEKKQLTRTTEKMEKMMDDMQRVIGSERQIGQTLEPQKNKSDGERDSIANEIKKNRQEMYGIHAQENDQKKDTKKTLLASRANAQNTNKKNENANMTFSSNHTLPAEKEKKSPKATRNYYHISPIGQDHNVRKDD